MATYKKGDCMSPYGKGRASIEYYKDTVPQYYCYGIIDRVNDELIEACKKCPYQVGKAEADHINDMIKELRVEKWTAQLSG